MSTPQTDSQEVQRYIEMLCPDPPLDAWLVVSWLVSKDDFRSQWFRVAQRDDVARFIVQQAQHSNVYLGLGLRHPDCSADPGTRGTSQDVLAIGGVWIELDHNAGVHAAPHLPTPDELLAFIKALPFRFSLLVDSTGGYHGYLLFKELWILDTPEERQQAALLLRRFQRTIQAQAAAYGWKVDGTADLARVLRPAGTLNHKSGTPRPVTFLHEDAARYNPSDIADAPWLATIEDTYTPSSAYGNFPPAQIESIVTGCAWLRHCRDDAAALSEPEWYGMLGIVGRCEAGEQMAHEWSVPYPRYSKDETVRKLQHALADAGPRTCNTIRFDLGAHSYCRDCQHWGKIKSPIVLGTCHQTLTAGGSNGQSPPNAYQEGSPATALLDTLRATAEEQRSSREIFAAIDALAALPINEWAVWKADAKALLGSRLNLNDLEKARNAALKKASSRGHASNGVTPGGSAREAPGAGSTLAAALATTYQGQLAYDLARQCWMRYGATRPGIWGESEEEVVLGEMREALTALLPDGFSWNLLQGVERLLRTHLHRRFAMAPSGWLPFPKGALDLETMTFHPHSPDRSFTWCLPYDYDPTATCPKTQAFFHEALNGAHGEVQVVRAFLKAIVLGRVDLQRYPEFIGPGGTGKGTTIRIAQALVGIENVVTTELKHLESNRFETSSLYGKRLIAITDAERYSGPVNVLKAITGQDIVRMEEKFKRQRQGVVEGLVMVAANEPIQSADYTSGLERRRATLVFRHRPKEPRDLLSIKGGVFQGELVEELPGILNWVLALPDSAMEALMRHTSAMVPSLAEAWAHALVDTNPLADWANRALVRDDRRDTEGRPVSVNVGVAKQMDRSKSYEHEDFWLYPNYRAWVDATGGKAIALRRFTALLLDLFQNQLRFEWVGHTDDQHGSRFHGIRLRSPQDKDILFVTGLNPAPMTDVTDTLTDEPRANDGCDGCDRFLQKFSIPPPPPLHPNGDARSVGDVTQGEGVSIGGTNGQHPSNLSHPSSVRENGAAHLSHPSSTRHSTLLAVGDWVWLVSADGVQQNATPYQVQAIAPGSDGRLYARFAETATGWPVVQCERTPPPAPIPITSPPPEAPPPPRPDPGGAQACPQCGRPLNTVVGGKGVFCRNEACRYRALVVL